MKVTYKRLCTHGRMVNKTALEKLLDGKKVQHGNDYISDESALECMINAGYELKGVTGNFEQCEYHLLKIE